MSIESLLTWGSGFIIALINLVGILFSLGSLYISTNLKIFPKDSKNTIYVWIWPLCFVVTFISTLVFASEFLFIAIREFGPLEIDQGGPAIVLSLSLGVILLFIRALSIYGRSNIFLRFLRLVERVWFLKGVLDISDFLENIKNVLFDLFAGLLIIASLGLGIFAGTVLPQIVGSYILKVSYYSVVAGLALALIDILIEFLIQQKS